MEREIWRSSSIRLNFQFHQDSPILAASTPMNQILLIISLPNGANLPIKS
jgi:hypothetical protein